MKNILKLTIFLLLCSCEKDSENNLLPPTPPSDPPKGKTILFWRPNPEGGIFTIDEKGENEKKLLALPPNATVAHPNWSSDYRIYFTGNLQGEANAQIYSMKDDGSDVVRITNSPNVAYSQLEVSARQQLLYVKTIPDGSSNAGSYYSSANGTHEKKLFDLNGFNLKDVGWQLYNAWTGVIYISDEVKNYKNESVSNIFGINLEGSFKSNLTNNLNKNKVYHKLYIQTNEELFITTVLPDINTSGYEVYLIESDNSLGNGEQILLPTPYNTASWLNCNWAVGVFRFVFDPEDRAVGTLLLTDNKNNLHMYNFQGNNLKQLTHAPSHDAVVNNYY